MHYSELTNLVIVDRFTKFTPDLIDYSIFSFEPFCKKTPPLFVKSGTKNFCTISLRV